LEGDQLEGEMDVRPRSEAHPREGHSPGARVIDSDQHLFEYRGMWADHIDPGHRDDAIRFVDDDLGHTWTQWHEHRLGPADVQVPGETDAIGERRRRERAGEPPAGRYDDLLPREYWDPDARLGALDRMGLDEAMLFPNYGLAWERTVGAHSLPALLANMTAWNRWCATVRASSPRLHPVAHLSLRDLDWLERQLAVLDRAGIRTAMIAPGLVDGVRPSHPDLDRAWRSFVAHDITPVFHVADQPRVFADGWYLDEREFGPPALDSVFLHVAAAVTCTDLIVNGTLERFPDLRIGIVELSAVWVPMYLMMLDGGTRFINRLNGRAPCALSLAPSEYFVRQVRVSSFAYELPTNIMRQMHGADVLMACSDFPHSEGTAQPLRDYAANGKFAVTPADAPNLFAGNAEFVLRVA
jgi:hypothetical protein